MPDCKILTTLLITILLFGVSSCTNQNVQQGNTTSLNGLVEMGNAGSNPAKIRQAQLKKVRYTAITETALSLSAQGGLSARAEYLNHQLLAQATLLEHVYDFNALILEHSVIPPVLLEGRNVLNLADPLTIRIYDRTYKIAEQAHFVTTAPNWRQYLWLDYKVPERPNETLLPKDNAEREIWDENVAVGWANGVDQANNIFQENLAKLNEDFKGMLLYRKLLAMNMISPPYVSRAEMGVTGNETEMNINDQVLRIAALPGLNLNSNEWIPALSIDVDSLEKFRRMEKLVNSTKIVISDKAWQPVIPNTH